MSGVSMLCFAVLAVAAVSARPGIISFAPSAVPYVTGGHVSTQYHSQDNFGQYSYGYNNGFDSKTEHRTLDGVTRGSYSYVDAEGKLQSVHYTADPVFGFRVAATNLPEDSGAAPAAVQDTPEVAQAKAEHLKAVEQAKAGVVPAPNTADLPVPVQDTPEVAQAKAEHLKAVEEAKVRDALAPVAPVEVGTPFVKYEAPVVNQFSTYSVPTFSAPITTPSFKFDHSFYAPYYSAPLTYASTLGGFEYPAFSNAFPQAKIDVTKVGYPYA